jgi:exonuclease III
MLILNWNCRGLGNLRTVNDLCKMIKVKKPDVVFIIETKLHHKKMEKIKVRLGFQNCFVVDSVGRSGGLALLWNDRGGKPGDPKFQSMPYSCNY